MEDGTVNIDINEDLNAVYDDNKEHLSFPNEKEPNSSVQLVHRPNSSRHNVSCASAKQNSINDREPEHMLPPTYLPPPTLPLLLNNNNTYAIHEEFHSHP